MSGICPPVGNHRSPQTSLPCDDDVETLMHSQVRTISQPTVDTTENSIYLSLDNPMTSQKWFIAVFTSLSETADSSQQFWFDLILEVDEVSPASQLRRTAAGQTEQVTPSRIPTLSDNGVHQEEQASTAELFYGKVPISIDASVLSLEIGITDQCQNAQFEALLRFDGLPNQVLDLYDRSGYAVDGKLTIELRSPKAGNWFVLIDVNDTCSVSESAQTAYTLSVTSHTEYCGSGVTGFGCSLSVSDLKYELTDSIQSIYYEPGFFLPGGDLITNLSPTKFRYFRLDVDHRFAGMNVKVVVNCVSSCDLFEQSLSMISGIGSPPDYLTTDVVRWSPVFDDVQFDEAESSLSMSIKFPQQGLWYIGLAELSNSTALPFQKEECGTISGPHAGVPCVFPFVYEGVSYRSCSSMGNNGIYWCATMVDENGEITDGHWGNCAENCPKDCQTISGPHTGTSCMFPFVYDGVVFNSCVSVRNNGTYWCATMTDENYNYIEDHWGNCDSRCPREPPSYLLSIGSVSCASVDCSNHGDCSSSRIGAVITDVCECTYGWTGDSCALDTGWKGSTQVKISSTILVISNMAMIPVVYRSVKYRFYTEAMILGSNSLVSALYHSCDIHLYCLTGYWVLQIMDFTWSFLSIGVIIIFMSDLHAETRHCLYFLLIFILAALWDIGADDGIKSLIVASISAAFLFGDLLRKILKKRRTKQISCWTSFVQFFKDMWCWKNLGVALLSLVGAVVCKFYYFGEDSYFLVHSFWHLFIMVAAYLFVRAKRKYRKKKAHPGIDKLRLRNVVDRDEGPAPYVQLGGGDDGHPPHCDTTPPSVQKQKHRKKRRSSWSAGSIDSSESLRSSRSEGFFSGFSREHSKSDSDLSEHLLNSPRSSDEGVYYTGGCFAPSPVGDNDDRTEMFPDARFPNRDCCYCWRRQTSRRSILLDEQHFSDD